MTNKTAADVLSGTDAKLFLDGEEIGIWQNIELTVTLNYEDVQIGEDVDRNCVSMQGDGSLSYQTTNSLTTRLFNKIKANRNVRFSVEAELKSKTTGEVESYSADNISFDSIPLANWAKGELVKKEMSFRFTPSKLMINSMMEN